MRLVHSILYQLCNAYIGWVLIVVTVLLPIKTKDYTQVFSVAVQFVLQPT